MKIVTWNINGIRSLKQHVKDILKELDADIVCFQETKISRSLLPEDTALIDGYSSYFSFPKWQSGYSGVATYCRDSCTPTKAAQRLCWDSSSLDEQSNIGSSCIFSDTVNGFSFDLSSLDNEGRAIMTQHELQNGSDTEKLVVINVYCPRVDPEKPERREYKMQFCLLLEARAKALVQEGYHVVIVGDLNIAHQPIDHCDPCDEREFKAHEARIWLTSFLDPKVHDENGSNTEEEDPRKFVDTFRFYHPEQKGAYTCWNTLTGARQTNYGTRIDYILSSKKILPFITSCKILPEVFGSDHCPVQATFCCDSLPSSQLPSSCCRLWPEFSGQQQKLLSFLSKSASSKLNDEATNKRKTDVSISSQKEKKKNKMANGTQKQKAITNFFTNSRAEKIDKFLSNEDKLGRKQNDVQGEMFSKENSDEKSGDDPNTNISKQTEEPFRSADKDETDETDKAEFTSTTKTQSEMWKRVLCGPPPPPLCKGHAKACVLRTVRKEGPNFGRQFFACSQPNGHMSNPESRCNFFQWVTSSKISVLKKK